jgi:hypothetical protein
MIRFVHAISCFVLMRMRYRLVEYFIISTNAYCHEEVPIAEIEGNNYHYSARLTILQNTLYPFP